MSNERESLLPAPSNNDNNLPAVVLTYVDYDIAGNIFRAYYDNAQRMVFVVDSTQSLRKPNVLLVLLPDGERKWDDILANDWGVDLETIRPRKDNKYQKLDVEYGNLDAYVQLVRDFQTDSDLQDVLSELNAFRDDAVRRNARARLDVGRDVVARTRETIEKTDASIKELNARMKDLRAKLSKQKKLIGKEPTKQSAAKILRSDSMIDATGEKIERARRRLANARRRMLVAEDDITAAQKILELLDAGINPDAGAHSVMVAPRMDVVKSDNANDSNVPQFKEIITEPKAEEMAEEEVKPLFDKDPEILDEEIAFKPIDFGVSAVTPSPARDADVVVKDEMSSAPVPLSFTPPQNSEYVAPVAAGGNFAPIPDVPTVPDVAAAPVLDSMRPVDTVSPAYDVRPTPATDERAFATAAAEAPIVQNPGYDNLGTNNMSQPTSVPEYNNSYNSTPVSNARPTAPMPGVADASVASGFRPVSPIRGASVSVPANAGQRKPKLIYYVMLVILIALSIFTLWIYQRSTSQNIPELTTTAKNTDSDPVADDAKSASSPFIDMKEVPEPVVATPEPVATPVVVEPEPEPVVVEPVPEPLPEPEPVVTEPEPEVAEPTPVDNTGVESDVTITTVEASSPFLTEPVEKPKIEPITIEPIVNKPAYNVSQQEKMFVADSEYETDAPVANNQNVSYAVEDVQADEGVVCSDGAFPDANGCCGGEVFTDMENGTFACCQPVEGGECFAPLR